MRNFSFIHSYLILNSISTDLPGFSQRFTHVRVILLQGSFTSDLFKNLLQVHGNTEHTQKSHFQTVSFPDLIRGIKFTQLSLVNHPQHTHTQLIQALAESQIPKLVGILVNKVFEKYHSVTF